MTIGLTSQSELDKARVRVMECEDIANLWQLLSSVGVVGFIGFTFAYGWYNGLWLCFPTAILSVGSLIMWHRSSIRLRNARMDLTWWKINERL